MTALGKLLRKEIDPNGPGAAVLVVERAQVSFQKCYGLADLENRVPITPRTVFDLASVSKQFTAMAILILAERGLLSFADDVRDFLPKLPVDNSRRPILLTDLLRHTSGLPDYSSIWRGAKKETRLTNARYLGQLFRHPLDFPTGSRAEYSNSNYVVLAVVIERVSRKPFARFMQEEIFKPLGMKNSFIHDCHGLGGPRRARGYKRTKTGKVRPSDIPIILVGHSHLFSTLQDMARWEIGLQKSFLVSPPGLDQAFTAGRLDDGTQHGYGFGWYMETVARRQAWAHSGEWYGFSSYVCRFLSKGLTVVILSNDESLDAETLGGRIAKLFLGQTGGA
jgi:CubicO group peptidase (beta-lactamase class C family)